MTDKDTTAGKPTLFQIIEGKQKQALRVAEKLEARLRWARSKTRPRPHIDQTYTDAAHDDCLVQQTLAGDAAAFNMIVTRYRSMVVRYTQAILRDDTLSEDAAQDTFITALEYLHTYRGPRAFRPWLKAIAYQQAINYIRRRNKRRNDVSIEGESDRHQRPWAEVLPAHPKVQPISEELLGQLPAMLARIDHKKSEAIRLHILVGLSLHEVALRQGINQSTASRRVQAGLSQLRYQFASVGTFARASLPRKPPGRVGPLLRRIEEIVL